MNQEHTDYLVKTFPNLYILFNESDIVSPMAFGFECGDGWFNLIKDLSEQITKADPYVRAHQVKEKFGSLRFYTGNSSNEVYDFIDKASEQSEKICDVCGAEGKLEGSGWLMTRCDEHKLRGYL